MTESARQAVAGRRAGRSAPAGESPVRSVARAVAVLEQFSLQRPELTFTEISSGIHLTKSTTHRLLAALLHEEMIEFDAKRARYRLGLRVFRLGSVVSKTMEVGAQSDSLLEELAEETGETAYVVVPDGDETLCVRRYDGGSHVRILFLEVGKRQAYNCGAAPRVLLAHLPPERWEAIVAGHVQAMTEHSLMSRSELAHDRDEVLLHGYAVSREDVTLHACALGAPVHDETGEVVAAVSISGIEQRFTAERLPELIERIVAAGAELSRRLGYQERSGGHERPGGRKRSGGRERPGGRKRPGNPGRGGGR
jgi:IclR family KDG regulon transcriptional repressor